MSRSNLSSHRVFSKQINNPTVGLNDVWIYIILDEKPVFARRQQWLSLCKISASKEVRENISAVEHFPWRRGPLAPSLGRNQGTFGLSVYRIFGFSNYSLKQFQGNPNQYIEIHASVIQGSASDHTIFRLASVAPGENFWVLDFFFPLVLGQPYSVS